MKINNVTAQVIIDTIEETFEGETLEFLASFFDYCNDRTRYGVPCRCCPLNSDMNIAFGTLTVNVSNSALETGYSVECLYTIEEEAPCNDNPYYVYVTPYAYDDEEYFTTTEYACFQLTFNVVDPRELERLCSYIGVAFQFSYFE